MRAAAAVNLLIGPFGRNLQIGPYRKTRVPQAASRLAERKAACKLVPAMIYAMVSETAASCIVRAASSLAACARPALSISGTSTPEELSSALTDLVAAAELFGCKPSFWRWAAQAASLLGRRADAETYRKRAPEET